MTSRDFALKLLHEKRCAIAPGSAFSTFDPLLPDDLCSIRESARREECDLMLNSFCRVSLASSTENVVRGVGLVCDLLDELQR